jgi:ferredoxin
MLESRERGLAQIGDNIQNKPNFICNCCGCCCQLLVSFKKFGAFGPTFTSNFIATAHAENCIGCGKCAEACPVSAIELISFEHEAMGKKYKLMAKIDEEMCLGCGVCHTSCKTDSLRMQARAQRQITPETTMKRILLQALEQGKLHHYLADQLNGFSSLAGSAFLKAIFSLPPTKRILLTQSVKSRFIDYLVNMSIKAGSPGAEL